MEKEEQSLPPLHGHKKFLCFKGRGRNKNKSVSVRAGGNDPYPRIQALLKRVAYSDRGVPNPWAKDSVPIQSGSHSVVPNSLQLHQLQLLCPWNSPGKNTIAHSHSLPQGIFLTQGLNSGPLHCRQILYNLTTRSLIILGKGRKIFPAQNPSQKADRVWLLRALGTGMLGRHHPQAKVLRTCLRSS